MTATDVQRRVLFVAALGSFLSSLSASIVGVALPSIGEWAGLGIHDVAWATLVPMLVIASFLLPAGWAGDSFGHRHAYIVGSAFGTIGSLGCALAPNFASLLVFRGVQGVGAALAMASSPALITLTADPAHRGRALGVTSTALYVGLTLGPPLGGWLASLAGFRAVFLAQVPLSLVLLIVCRMWLPQVQPSKGLMERSGSLDLFGAALLAGGMCGVLVGLARGGEASVPTPVLLGLAGVVCLALFLAHERRTRAPLLDLALFANRSFLSATLGAFLNYVALFHANFLLPFYLVDTRQMDTGHAGTLLMVMPLVMSLVAGPSGHLSDRIGSRSLAAVGMVLLAAGLALLATCDGHTPLWLVVATLVLMGIGTGTFVTPNTNTLMGAAPRGAQGSAAGVMALARTSGMMVGTALAAVAHEVVRIHAVEEGWSASDAEGMGLRVAWVIGSVVAVLGAAVVLVRPSPNAPTTHAE